MILVVSSITENIVLAQIFQVVIVSIVVKSVSLNIWSWSSVFDINSMEPLGDDKEVHPAEETPEDDETGDDLSPEVWQPVEVDGVGSLLDDTDRHVQDSHDHT